MAKFELQDFVQFGQLFECYGTLLSDDRQKIMTAYFEFNETLAEIAEERKISRQAVLDSIKKSCGKLQNFENALELCAKKQKFLKELNEVLQFASEHGQDEIVEKVENILKEI